MSRPPSRQARPPRNPSWQKIPQPVGPSARRRGGGRRSRSRRGWVWALAVAIAALAIYGSYRLLFPGAGLPGPEVGEPVREILYETDGTLDRAWLESRLALPAGARLPELDIFALRERLQEDPQVRAATVRRRFPDALQVTVEERVPVARLVVREGAERKVLLVGRDGVVYEGRGLSGQRTGTLPFLTGVRLRATGQGRYEPLEGFREITDLLDTARAAYPGIAATWRIVDLSGFSPGREDPYSTVRVHSTVVRDVLFALGDYRGQLQRLRDILDVVQAEEVDGLERVDLRFGESVPVVVARERAG